MCNPMIAALGLGGLLLVVGCVREHQGGLEVDDDSPGDDGALDASPADEGMGTDDDGSADDDSMTRDRDASAASPDDDAMSGTTDGGGRDWDAGSPREQDDHEGLDAAAVADASAASPDAAATFDAGASPGLLDSGAPSGAIDWIDEEACVYHSPPVPFPPLAADAGPDAGHPPAPQLTIGENAFVGQYLADSAGFALYIYTADFPGDCDTPPVSTCFEDCLLAWPIFEAGDRELAEGLDDHAMGTFMRSDGVAQTTYYGWPLYYYRRDVEPGQTLGQGKGQVWFLAELQMPNVVIMRAPEERDGIKYLADGRGFTLYTHAGDVPGTESVPPQPDCSGDCARSFTPFNVRSLRPVTDLEPGLFTVFVDPVSGRQQVSFRGWPLYLSTEDTTSGDMNGVTHEGFSVVLP